MNKDWYSVNEVAEILGESYKKIYNLVVPRYLFGVDFGFVSALNKAELPAALRTVFQLQDRRLTAEAKVTVIQADSRWVIKDFGAEYFIRNKNPQLDVFLPPELGSYQVGRSYRIRKADLEAYFAKQDKELHPVSAPAPAVMEAVVLDRAGAVAQRVQESAAEPERRLVPSAPPASTEAQTASLWPWFADESAGRAAVSAPAAQGEVQNGRATRRREADYVEQFQQLFRNGLAVSHPTTDDIIRFNERSEVLQGDDLYRLAYYLNLKVLYPEHELNYPHNERILYPIAQNSLHGLLRKYPKEALLIECATLSRLERFVSAGQDEERLHRPDVENALQERRAEGQKILSERYGAPLAYLLGLASTTGWDQESIEFVQNFSADPRIFLYLIDLVDLAVYASNANEKSVQYIEIYEPPLGARKLMRIQQQIRELLLANGAMHITDLQAQIGSSHKLIREACLQLAKSHPDQPDYRIFDEGGNMVIRFG